MGQLIARRGLLFLFSFTGYRNLQGGNVRSQPCFLAHRNTVKMPPSVRDRALSSEVPFCLWAAVSHWRQGLSNLWLLGVSTSPWGTTKAGSPGMKASIPRTRLSPEPWRWGTPRLGRWCGRVGTAARLGLRRARSTARSRPTGISLPRCK